MDYVIEVANGQFDWVTSSTFGDNVKFNYHYTE